MLLFEMNYCHYSVNLIKLTISKVNYKHDFLFSQISQIQICLNKEKTNTFISSVSIPNIYFLMV